MIASGMASVRAKLWCTYIYIDRDIITCVNIYEELPSVYYKAVYTNVRPKIHKC